MWFVAPSSRIDFIQFNVEAFEERVGNTQKFKMTWGVGPNEEAEDQLFNFILCKLLESTAARVALHPNHGFYGAVSRMGLDRKNLLVIDTEQDHREIPHLRAMFAPIEEEFAVEFDMSDILGSGPLSFAPVRLWTHSMPGHPEPLGFQLSGPLSTLYSSMHSFFLGIERRLQIDIPLQKTLKALDLVGKAARNPVIGTSLRRHTREFVTGSRIRYYDFSRKMIRIPFLGRPLPRSKDLAALIEPPFLPPIVSLKETPTSRDWMLWQVEREALRLGLPHDIFHAYALY